MSSFSVSVRNDFASVAKDFARDVRRKVEVAQQRALIDIAKEVKEAEAVEMNRVFDRPTPFTTNALTTKFDKPKMEVRIEVKDGYWSRADNYLDTQIEGGSSRRQKAFERALTRAGLLSPGWVAVPGEGARLDAFGNVSVGQIKQIMSWFDAAEPYRGSTQNMGEKGRDKRRKGTRTKRGFEFFAALPGHRVGRGSWKNGRTQNLAPGIYQRTFFNVRTEAGSARISGIKPVLLFVRSAGYQKRYPFHDIAQRTVDRVADSIVSKALAREFGR